tara:strand:- start:305 stop:622 length:318 start_codon:yes stop_codon:yes gene_type:complete
MDEQIKIKIDELVKSKKVFLFMKGSPDFPQCGFSGKVVEVLKDIDFGSCNVLQDEAIREGIKEYGNWPTIPQLYVNGKLVGGCDIICEMAENGELKNLLADGSES